MWTRAHRCRRGAPSRSRDGGGGSHERGHLSAMTSRQYVQELGYEVLVGKLSHGLVVTLSKGEHSWRVIAAQGELPLEHAIDAAIEAAL